MSGRAGAAAGCEPCVGGIARVDRPRVHLRLARSCDKEVDEPSAIGTCAHRIHAGSDSTVRAPGVVGPYLASPGESHLVRRLLRSFGGTTGSRSPDYRPTAGRRAWDSVPC